MGAESEHKTLYHVYGIQIFAGRIKYRETLIHNGLSLLQYSIIPTLSLKFSYIIISNLFSKAKLN